MRSSLRGVSGTISDHGESAGEAEKKTVFSESIQRLRDEEGVFVHSLCLPF